MPTAIRRIGIFVSFAAALSANATPLADAFTTTERRELQREGRLIVDLLQNFHYTTRQFNEVPSKDLIDALIARLDSAHLVFTKVDIEAIHRRFDRTFKNVYLLKGDDQPGRELFDRYRDKVAARMRWISTQLDAGIDLDANDRSPPAPYSAAPTDEADANRRWLLALKQALISERLNGHDPEAALREVRRTYARWAKQIESVSAEEVREQFWEAMLNTFDPHSGYFAHDSAQEFETMMAGSICGVGMDVEMIEGTCTVSSVLAGGPAEEDGTIGPGDEIVGIAEADGPWADPTGKRAADVLRSMRGELGSVVRIAFRSSPTGVRHEVKYARRTIVLGGLHAHATLLDIPITGSTTVKIGWIDLPDFYVAGNQGAKSSATRDVRELLDRMRSRGVQGVVVDLRHNGGGALTEAVGLAGLFVPSGTAFVSRDTNGTMKETPVETNRGRFDGPLVVLTSAESASASEMFADTMRFHRRAIIVGSEHTFGKGTMQHYMDLNKVAGTPDGKLGTLRLTTEIFYAPDGRSPQRCGIPSDIVIPHRTARNDFESDYINALPEMKIDRPDARPAVGTFAAVDAPLRETVADASKKRFETWPEFGLQRQSRQLYERAITDAESARLSDRIEAQKQYDAEHERLNREWTEFAAAHAYSTEDIELAAVARARNEQVELARRRMAAGANPKAGWLAGDRFWYEDAEGRIRDITLDRLPFRRMANRADVLAPIFAGASGLTVDAQKLSAGLWDAAQMDRITARKLVVAIAHRLASDDTLAPIQQGLEAGLSAVVRADPTLYYPAGTTDVNLREATRVAADWVAQREIHGQPAVAANGVAPSVESSPSRNQP